MLFISIWVRISRMVISWVRLIILSLLWFLRINFLYNSLNFILPSRITHFSSLFWELLVRKMDSKCSIYFFYGNDRLHNPFCDDARHIIIYNVISHSKPKLVLVKVIMPFNGLHFFYKICYWNPNDLRNVMFYNIVVKYFPRCFPRTRRRILVVNLYSVRKSFIGSLIELCSRITWNWYILVLTFYSLFPQKFTQIHSHGHYLCSNRFGFRFSLGMIRSTPLQFTSSYHWLTWNYTRWWWSRWWRQLFNPTKA